MPDRTRYRRYALLPRDEARALQARLVAVQVRVRCTPTGDVARILVSIHQEDWGRARTALRATGDW